VLEFGVVTLSHGQVTDGRTRLCGPIGKVAPSETEVHGLSEAMLLEAAPFAHEWEYFADLRERGPLAAHFAGVENALIKSVWPYPRSSPDFARPGAQVVGWGPWLDTARIYAQLYPNLESGRLESLVTVSGLEGELTELAMRYCPPHRRHYHAALYDALAGALLLNRLARDPELAQLTIMQLLALSTLDPRKRDEIQQGELF
jgi:DNA polymerase-3 subunit epsilon